jgi:hypothetical protein
MALLKDWLARLMGWVTQDDHRPSVFVWVPPGAPDPTVHGLQPLGSPEERESELRWLSEEESPFGLRVLDCRRVSRGMVSTAENQACLERYVALRGDTGESLRRRHPPDARTVPCALRYPSEPGATAMPNGRRFVSLRLEYKWDIAHWDGALLFTHSWTGKLVYRAPIMITANGDEPGVMSIAEIEAAAGKHHMESDAYVVATVDFLIQAYLLGRIVPHPIPKDIEAAPERTIALWCFQTFGCAARYGRVVP